MANLSTNITEISKPTLERLWGKVSRLGPNDCWPWNAATSSTGYGVFSFWSDKTMVASRAIYLAVHGSIPDGHVVMHSCDNPPCCNPAHLSVGTQSANIRDSVAKGRFKRNAVRRQRSEHTEAIMRALAAHQVRGQNGIASKLAAKFGVSKQLVWKITAEMKSGKLKHNPNLDKTGPIGQ